MWVSVRVWVRISHRAMGEGKGKGKGRRRGMGKGHKNKQMFRDGGNFVYFLRA